VAATGAVRNFAKFLAPAAFGAFVLMVPLAAGFVAVGTMTLASAAGTVGLRPLDPLLERPAES
jgi:hypothetical protein